MSKLQQQSVTQQSITKFQPHRPRRYGAIPMPNISNLFIYLSLNCVCTFWGGNRKYTRTKLQTYTNNANTNIWWVLTFVEERLRVINRIWILITYGNVTVIIYLNQKAIEKETYMLRCLFLDLYSIGLTHVWASSGELMCILWDQNIIWILP